MRDFPLFTTENGVGSLVLKEIPYSGIAYVTLRDSAVPSLFLHDCLGFCKAVGAQTVYATGHDILEEFPVHTSVLLMSAPIEVIPETDASLFPITESTLTRWCEIYNDRMKNVDNAAYMSGKAAAELLKKGNGYFIHRDGELLGIGIASDDRIECVASYLPGSGKDIVSALTHALMCDRVILEVASTNKRAITLYESMGFIRTAELSKWYKIF